MTIYKQRTFISVESKPGQGACFTIYLPAKAGQLSTEAVTAPVSHQGRGRILVMADQEMILNMIERILNRMGYETTCAKDGKQAIQLYREALAAQQPFDLLILDLTVLSGMSGIETVKQLLTIDPQVKAIVSSGYSNDPIMANFQDYGFCGIAPKPYTRRQLSEVLEKVSGL